MEEQIISFETAKLLHSRGISRVDGVANGYYLSQDCVIYQPGLNGYWKDKRKEGEYFKRSPELTDEYKGNYRNIIIPAPTQSLLQKWLREEENIFVTIRLYQKAFKKDFKYGWCVQNNENGEYLRVDGLYIKSYEEALEKGLQYAIKQINNVS